MAKHPARTHLNLPWQKYMELAVANLTILTWQIYHMEHGKNDVKLPWQIIVKFVMAKKQLKICHDV